MVKAKANNIIALGAFLVIEGAFDNTPIEVIKKDLSDFEINRSVTR